MREQLWAMDPTYLQAWLFARENPNPDVLKAASSIFDDDEDDDEDDLKAMYSVVDGIAHISMSGPLTMSGPNLFDRIFGFGGTSYANLMKCADMAENDPMVSRAILEGNTPGGDVNGCDLTWQRFRAFSKPLICRASGMLASAGYYVASACEKIYATGSIDRIGSIGVVMSQIDDSEYLASKGIKRVTITSSNAPNKRPDLATKEGRSVLQEQADALERGFIARISEGRGLPADYISQNFGRGGLLVARDPDSSKPSAVKCKMIDGVMEMQKADRQSFSIALASEDFGHHIQSAATAGTPSQEVSMTLDEFLAQNPDARAAMDQRIAAAKAEGAKSATDAIQKVGAILSSETYMGNAVIRNKAVEVLQGKMSVDSFFTVVSTLDAVAEQNRQAGAQAQTKKSGETPVNPDGPSAEVMAKAKELKINVDAVKAASAASKTDFATALAAEINLQETIRKDKG